MLHPLLLVLLVSVVLLDDHWLHLLEELQLHLQLVDEGLALRVSVPDLVEHLRIDDGVLEQDRFDALVILLHDVLVSELLLDLEEPLDVGVHDLAVLLAVALRHGIAPSEAVELQEEVQNEEGVSHVDEGKANALVGLQVHGQVEVVVLAVEVLVDQLQHVVLHKLDRDVLDHQRSKVHHLEVMVLLRLQDPEEVDHVVARADVDFLWWLLGLESLILLSFLFFGDILRQVALVLLVGMGHGKQRLARIDVDAAWRTDAVELEVEGQVWLLLPTVMLLPTKILLPLSCRLVMHVAWLAKWQLLRRVVALLSVLVLQALEVVVDLTLGGVVGAHGHRRHTMLWMMHHWLVLMRGHTWVKVSRMSELALSWSHRLLLMRSPRMDLDWLVQLMSCMSGVRWNRQEGLSKELTLPLVHLGGRSACTVLWRP